MGKKKILVVDDDIDVVAVLQTILENEGYKVIVAHNKSEAIRKAVEEMPDLAILDVMMTTHFEGFELAKELFDNKATRDIPRLMQTSIDVFETTSPDMIGMAREFRKKPDYKELEVLLIADKVSKKAGIDYRSRSGENIWVPIDGFLNKPVNSKALLPEVERLLV